jgi:predicted SnoaL-like aldol condensation-catalyzing enzyme
MKTLYSQKDDILNGKQFRIEFEDKEVLFLSFEPSEETNCSLSIIEDGIIQLIYKEKDTFHDLIIDLHRQQVILNIFNEKGHIKKTGTIKDLSNKHLSSNEEKAIDFWIRFFDQHDESAIDDYLSEPYIQHNPHVADGVEAFRNEFHERFKTDMKDCSTQIMRVSSRDDLVFIHNILKRSPDVKGHAAVDIFRFENGRIVEHWDVIQTMPDSSKNDHPMF